MNIIIAGCGKVGTTLGEQLVRERHEVTFIDTAPELLKKVMGMIDVQVIEGNCTYDIQMDAGVDKADLMIAVTNADEVNLLCCLIAKKASNCHTVARVRNPEYNEDIQFIKQEMGLSLTINPEWATAVEIARLIQIPSAMEVDSFANNRVNMIRFLIPEGSVLADMKVADVGGAFKGSFLICVIERNHEIIIPSGDVVLKKGDNISVIMPLAEVDKMCKEVGIHTRNIKNVMIAGGGTMSYYLAKILNKANKRVKIIEMNRKRCELLSGLLPKTMIIHGDATDNKLLEEEDLAATDAFVALTGFDEENLFLSLHAKKVANAKNIVKINRIRVEEVSEELNVGSVVSPKFITTEFILQYVRAMENSKSNNSIETLYRLMDNRVEALEFVVCDTPGLTGVQLQDLKLKKNLLLCCINRGGKIITPSGQDCLLEGDSVIVVTHLGLKRLSDILK